MAYLFVVPKKDINFGSFPLKTATMHFCYPSKSNPFSPLTLQVRDDREVLRHRAPPQALLGQKVPPARLRRRRPPLQRPQVLRVREKGWCSVSAVQVTGKKRGSLTRDRLLGNGQGGSLVLDENHLGTVMGTLLHCSLDVIRRQALAICLSSLECRATKIEVTNIPFLSTF